MDLVLRLTDADEIPDGAEWLIVERDDRRTVVVVDEAVNDESLCKLWRTLRAKDSA